MNLGRKEVTAGVSAGGTGEFDMILSNGARDREGAELRPEDWVQPIAEGNPININHSADVSDIVA
ncbi:Uncharacterised protein [Mycobacteroides abscessus subsp. abscessus]|nr:Uncharacterised protein [Mycobacteroides abscessus subsp. abscessus]